MEDARFNPEVVGVNATITLNSDDLGGFLCKTAGTVTVVDAQGTTVVSAHPVTAGTWYWMPFYLQGPGSTFTTAGGASGTVAAG